MTSRFLSLLALFTSVRLLAQQPDIGPPPGKLVDIGGRKLHLICSGSGTPTVVLEAGASAFAIDWTLVQQDIARTNRVCSYDRAGSGWSDPVPPSVTTNVASDLHALLRTAHEPPPYVMVGASLGGLLVRVFTADYPDEVVGLVVVDPASEERLFTLYAGQPVAIASLTAEQLRTTLPTHAVRVPRRPLQTGAPFDRLPQKLYQTRLKLDERLIASIPEIVSPEIVAASAEAERARLARLRELTTANSHPLGDRPLVVLTRGVDWSQGLQDTHASLARLSTNSRHSVVKRSGHEIHLFEPTAVITAIRDVLEAARTKTGLPARP